MDIFQEHSTVVVHLHVPTASQVTRVWPMPSPIPWDAVDSSWSQMDWTPDSLDHSQEVDFRWGNWAKGWENSLDSFVPSQPMGSLTKSQKGRLQRSTPVVREPQIGFLKPSREGEVQLRHDLIGNEVKRWFKQLRRLQSYVASIRAGKTTPEALIARLELWTSILRAHGFCGGFRHYWISHRAVTLPHTPSQIPSAPPAFPIALGIFETFRECFEAFEAWHVRQRRCLLKAKDESNHAAVFQDLKPPQKPLLDRLTLEHDYTILASDVSTGQIHVDRPLDVRGHSSWSMEDTSVQIMVCEDSPDICVVSPFLDFDDGTVLSQQQIITDTEMVHHELLTYWQGTWGAMASVDATVWARIVGFFRAFVPQFHFQIPPLSLSMWKKGLRRFKSTAARGVDGISPRDLLNLPDAWSLQLLGLLTRIEDGLDSWPTSVLYGVVNLLAKDDDAHTISRFRPVVVFSVVYRAWSSLRARQLLRQLQLVMDCDAFGFMPGAEPSQLWLLLQAEIETSMQHDSDLCGLSVDLVRAFNFIPRQHSFCLAEHLGVPNRVMLPWRCFLSRCTRAFRVHDTLSDAITSSCGMPEGDALSVFAMAQLDFAWHIYQRHFSPSVRACSFVDNLTLVAEKPSDLAQGYSCLVTFFELWNLRVDLDKSYCWSLSSQDRVSLRRFPMQLVYSASELGGGLSFCRRKYHDLQLKRCNKLFPRWFRLEKSMAPLFRKLLALVVSFWPAALHGANGSLTSEKLVHDLRVRAMRHLKLHKAGANPYLRLSLCPLPLADPGHWLLHHTVFSFRRLVAKEPVLHQRWISFHRHFDGSLYRGPFSQLIALMSQIGWSVQPPHVIDHDGCQHHLLNTPAAALHDLLLDGWLQYIATLVSSRDTMVDLCGLDTLLVTRLGKHLDPLQLSLLGSLQSGSFCAAAHHSKYDATKSPICARCGVKDDQAHWLVCPQYAAIRADIPDWDSTSQEGLALKCHLLPSRSPWDIKLKKLFLSIPDTTGSFESEPCEVPLQHLFSDGTKYTASDQCHCFASWVVLNSSSGQVVSRGFVPGVLQGSDRAELLGAISSLKWQAHFRCSMALWLDCKFVADGLLYLQESDQVPAHWDHQDLWVVAHDCLSSLGTLECLIRWNPSHLDPLLTTDPYEDWYRHWNNEVDRLANLHNFSRDPSFQATFDAAVDHSLTTWKRLVQFRSFYFKLAAWRKKEAQTSSNDISADNAENFSLDIFDASSDQATFCMVYNLQVADLVREGNFSFRSFPPEFAISIFDWLGTWSSFDLGVYRLTFVELTLALVHLGQIKFPFKPSDAKPDRMDILALSTSQFTKPTLAYLLKCVRDVYLAAIRYFDSIRYFDWGPVKFSPMAKIDLGLFRPCDGIYTKLPPCLVGRIQHLVIQYFNTRPFRTVADLAKPA